MIPKQTCRHCHKVGVTAVGRGLCIMCWSDTSVRMRYPCLVPSGVSQRPLNDPSLIGGGGTPEIVPEALPGSLEKLLLMEERARLGQDLFHPREAREGLQKITPAVHVAKNPFTQPSRVVSDD